jgi:hypothetical protein
MANYKGPTEGGSDGKRGHSNMEHWTYTEELKETSKVQRRIDSRSMEKEATDKFREGASCDECGSGFVLTSSEYKSLCSECAHWIYGTPRCEHEFSSNKCVECSWDGSTSKYIESIKGGSNA